MASYIHVQHVHRQISSKSTKKKYSNEWRGDAIKIIIDRHLNSTTSAVMKESIWTTSTGRKRNHGRYMYNAHQQTENAPQGTLPPLPPPPPPLPPTKGDDENTNSLLSGANPNFGLGGGSDGVIGPFPMPGPDAVEDISGEAKEPVWKDDRSGLVSNTPNFRNHLCLT